jgi:hypothetical protein
MLDLVGWGGRGREVVEWGRRSEFDGEGKLFNLCDPTQYLQASDAETIVLYHFQNIAYKIMYFSSINAGGISQSSSIMQCTPQ